jgi:probable HAF family extracellular repeat protein
MVDLGTLGGTRSYGYAINNAGQVAGEADTTDDAARHAFLYSGTPGRSGSMADLGTLGGTNSYGYAINSYGQVAGSSDVSEGGRHAFLYTGTPGANGQMLDLDAWLDSTNPVEGAKWTLWEARGLTDSGLITGSGFYDDGPDGLSDGQRAFILDASTLVVPEPTSALLLLSFAAIGVWRHRPGQH